MIIHEENPLHFVLARQRDKNYALEDQPRHVRFQVTRQWLYIQRKSLDVYIPPLLSDFWTAAGTVRVKESGNLLLPNDAWFQQPLFSFPQVTT